MNDDADMVIIAYRSISGIVMYLRSTPMPGKLDNDEGWSNPIQGSNKRHHAHVFRRPEAEEALKLVKAIDPEALIMDAGPATAAHSGEGAAKGGK
jgi:hypothetical protein